jgi:hypothetical protein
MELWVVNHCSPETLMKRFSQRRKGLGDISSKIRNFRDKARETGSCVYSV